MQGHDESSELKRIYVSITDKPKLLDPTTWPSIQVTLSGKKATSVGVLELVYQPEPPEDIPQTITWTRRREEWSGHGDEWGSWYAISSEPTPYRYTLASVDFRLDGDRQCGSWAECHQSRRDADGVTWQFRMQGHSEQTEFVNGAIRGKAAASTGVLMTTYRLTDPPTVRALERSRSSLKAHVKWAIAHEGCPVYTRDERTTLDMLRTCFMVKQAHNPEASYQISAHDDAVLTAVINESVAEIRKETTENFRWVCEHERETAAMQQFLLANDFDAIRRTYRSRQEHNPDARNQLAAASDSYLRELVTQRCRN